MWAFAFMKFMKTIISRLLSASHNFSLLILVIKNIHDSDLEIAMPLRKHIQVYVVNNSACGSLYFWSYTPWKIGFVASPEISQKQVFQVKTS